MRPSSPLRAPWPLVLPSALLALSVACDRGATEAPPPAPAPEPAAVAAAPPRPDVLIVVIDTLNRDRLSLYGHDRPTSPFLESEAERGVLFESVSAPAPFTAPSVASLFTGIDPMSTGVQEHRPDLTFPRINATVTEAFRDAGYATMAVVTNVWLSSERGFDQGFLDFEHHPSGAPAPTATAALEERIAAVGADQPFYAWLHLMDTHLPYSPASDLATRFREDAVGSRPMREFEERSVRLEEIYFGNRYTDEEIEQMRALYDAAVLSVDRAVGELVRDVRALERGRPLIVVYTADHGEALCQHGLCFAHEFTLYEELMAVPLVLVAPELLPRGARVAEPVRLIDVAPTLTELAGLELDGERDGESLVPLARGGDAGTPRPALAESGPRREDIDAGRRIYLDGDAGRWKMARVGRHKLIVVPHPDGDQLELYDVEADPGETRDLAAAQPELVEALRAEIARWVATRKGHPLEDDRPAPAPMSDEELERLRALGYAQ